MKTRRIDPASHDVDAARGGDRRADRRPSAPTSKAELATRARVRRAAACAAKPRYRRVDAAARRRRRGDPRSDRRGAVDARRRLSGLCRRLSAAARGGGRARRSAKSHASLVMHTRKLVQIQRAAREAQLGAEQQCAADRAGAQDAAGVLAGPARGAAAPGVAAADLALLCGDKLDCPERAGQRIDAGVRAAGQPARHLADQVGTRGSVVPLPAARRLPRGGAAARRAPGRTRTQRRAVSPRAGRAAESPRACTPRCRAGRSTCTASGRRCRARRSTSNMSSTCARCGCWSAKWPTAMRH